MYFLPFIVLAIVQGLTEFLPVSSSAHLILVRNIMNFKTLSPAMESAFDVALHFGTLIAIIVFFWKDLWSILISGLSFKKNDNKSTLFWSIIIASIPVALIGLLLDDILDKIFRNNTLFIALGLFVMAIVLFVFDKLKEQDKTMDKIGFKEIFLVGISQIIALFPGASRSGSTIAIARALKIEKETAFKLTFFLSIPVISGACLLKLIKHYKLILSNLPVFSIGIFISFIVGLLVIKYCLKYLKNNDYTLFVIYRIILSLTLIILFVLR